MEVLCVIVILWVRFAFGEDGHGHGQGHGQDQGHGHGHDHGLGAMDKEHQRQHVKDEYVDVNKLSHSEQIMEQFRMFDQDRDGQIDSLELLKSIIMLDHDHGKESRLSPNNEESLNMLDVEFRKADKNDDGFLTVAEYLDYMGQVTQTGAKEAKEAQGQTG